MKHFKSILATVLALVMVLSCVGTAFAADKTEIKDIPVKSEAAQKEDSLKGFKSETFKELNTYRYADDEIVRAIVILEGECEADVAEAGSEKAAAHRVKLVNQHNNVRKAMTGISYEMKFDFTRLLNGFSCDVAYGDLEAIAAIEGVEAVHISNTYAAPEITVEEDPEMAFANIMTGNYHAVNSENANGAGIVVAVLDTGLNITHEAFQDADGLCAESAVLTKEMVEAADLYVEGTYISEKVPFAYDYAENDGDVTDHSGHGTHVSGTAVGYAVTKYEDGGYCVDFCGAAPAAQLLSMKIFKDASGGTTADIYFYALEDAYTLGADVVNMSIGAQNGFTYDSSLESEVFGNIYKRMEDAGIIMSVAAGNEYSMAYFSEMGYVGAEYTDYGTVASPATYEGNVSVASVENFAYPSQFTMEICGETFEYIDSSTEEKDSWRGNFGGKTLDYVVVPGSGFGGISLGLPEDFAAADVKGKIAVIVRGELDFETKVENAYNAGAIGCIVINNQSGPISMAIETFEIPAVTLPVDAVEIFDGFPVGSLDVAADNVYIENEEGYLMSDFSNWGTSPSLTLDPAITSVGGKVYSSVPGADDAYEVYSGTSMAAPNATGTFANVLTAIYAKYPEMDKKEAAELAKDLLISSAYILYDADGYLYSPRKQGAGLADALLAIETEENAAYISNPLAELGDDPEKKGAYEFDVELVNNTGEDVQYFANSVVMIDYIANLNTEEKPIYGNTLTSDYLYDSTVTIDGEDAAKCYYDSFIDCEEDWYHEYVDYVCYAGFMNGVGNGKFAPEQALTRAMAVTVLYRMAGSPEVNEPASFEDVPDGQWYSDAIAWAEANGIVKGVSATKFAPEENVTREQIATILWRANGEEEIEADLSSFKDADSISDYAKTAICWAYTYGLMQGDTDGSLNPQDNATRAEFAAIMARFDGGAYECGSACVTVPAGKSKTVKVTITLGESDKAYLDETFENGTFIEGYVEFSNYDSYVHSTYLAYYGDWNDGDILESADFRDIIDAELWLNTTVVDEEGNTYGDYGYNWYNSGLLDFYTYPNVALAVDAEITKSYSYAGDNMLAYTDYYEEHISFSTPLTDGTWNYAESIYMTPYQLRNLEHLVMTVSNKETGEVYYVDDTQYLPKAYYDSDYGWSNTGVFYWDGKDAKGEYVPSGTVATITYDAVLPYNQKEVKGIWGMDVTVDYTAPTLDSVVFDAEACTVTVTATDENYLQAIYLADAYYDILDAQAYSSDKKGESFTATFDVSEYVEDGELSAYVVAMDYATNEMEQEVFFFETGLEATVTLKTPLGDKVIECVTGERIMFEEPEAPENYYFTFWVPEEVEKATEEEIWNVPGPWYYEGDEMLIVDQEYTFYALYAVGKEVALEKANYYLDYDADYTGEWAICGWDTDSEGYLVTEKPFALSNSGAKVDVSAFEDVEMGEKYIEFYTNADDIRWTITALAESAYAIQTADGKFLALDEDSKLIFLDSITNADALDLRACWIIFEAGNGYGTQVFNYANQNAYLTYDYIASDFAVFDRTQTIYGTSYYPHQVFFLSFYRCETTTIETDYYTTK